ncbi:DUF805 domain-containing protein [Proteobacteria bacterium 005FR1]|nr:DUF805 domain-containing protein [Proteobacteria bacterium 005FR1]
MEWYLEVLKKYAVFDGRAQRVEFWWFVLINLIIAVVLGWISETLSSIYGLAVLLPAIGVSIRRLHDTGRTGWWLLLSFLPVIGTIILIIFYVQDSEEGTNEYGPNPKALGRPA